MNHQRSNDEGEMIQASAHENMMGLKLLQIAGGDAAFAHKLREMFWQEYGDADYPYGASEEGLFRWMEDQIRSN